MTGLRNFGTAPTDEVGTRGVLPERATHVLLELDGSAHVLTPEQALTLSQNLLGQLPAVGYRLAAVPVTPAPPVELVAQRIDGLGFGVERGEWRYVLHEPSESQPRWASSGSHADETIDRQAGWYRVHEGMSDALEAFEPNVRRALSTAWAIDVANRPAVQS